MRRIFIAAAGVAALGIAIYRAPVWWDMWHAGAVLGAIIAAAAALVLAVGIAIRGRPRAVKRVALEIAFFGCALVVAETVLLLRAPDKWSSDPLVQRMISYERAAREQAIAYDARVPAEVIDDLRSKGLNTVPGFAENIIANPAVSNAIRERGLVPLSNVANAIVVECNEGTGYLQFRSDQYGFNNPPGVAAGSVDVAVIGESLALGHCVAPAKSAVDRVRARFARTANFGIAGSRVLSQVGVFREYVEPLKPKVVVWFVNVNFAEPRHESDRPILLRYLNDASFSQGLRQRQNEVDALLRDVVVPLHRQRDEALREELERASAFPLQDVIKLAEVRGLVDLELATRQAPEVPDLSDFERAVDRVAETAKQWGGRVVVVISPSYEIAEGRPQDVARYEAVSAALQGADVTVVDGPALFAAEPDFRSLFTLRMDNHPGELGHAVLGKAVIAAIDSGAGVAMIEGRRHD